MKTDTLTNSIDFEKKKMSGLPFLVCPLPLAPIREHEEEEEEEERKKKVRTQNVALGKG